MRARTTTLAAAGITLALTLAGCATSTNTGSAMSPTASAPATASATAPASAADIAFAQLMIPHHQQAIQMADLAANRATNPQVKALAAQIKAAQDPEIQQMGAWLAAWGASTAMPSTSASGSMGGMSSGHEMGGVSAAGMMTAEQMDALAKASGTEFDTMWLQMMIAHHQGAITMAQQVQATTQDPDVQALAKAIIDGQTAEIATMRQLLAGGAG